MIGAITAGLYGTGVPPVTNSYESIATVTVGSGGSSSISFTGIASTYKHLQIRMIGRTDRASLYGDYGKLTFNSDSGANYSDHQLLGDGSAASAAAASSANFIRVNRFAGATAPAGDFGGTVIDVLDYADVNKYKTLRNLGGVDANGSGDIFLISGNWRSTSAITSITIAVGGGTVFNQYSQFALYGIKG